jgi:Mg-chelatase subunit ChlD
VVFCLDISYSMTGEPLDNAKQALIDNARQMLQTYQGTGAECKIGVVTFSDTADIMCDPTADVAMIEPRVRAIDVVGMTAMDDGISQAVFLAMSAPAGTDRDVVLLTDGMPDDGREQSTRDAAEDARSKGVTLSALAIGTDGVDMNYLNSLTPLTFQIDAPDQIGDGVATLLTRSQERRDGLTERNRP